MSELIRRIVGRWSSQKTALATTPQAAQAAMRKLLQSVKSIELPDGLPDYEAYIESIDSYRDVLFFIRKSLPPNEYKQLINRLKALETMSDNPFTPDKAMQKVPHVFDRAKHELVFLEASLEEALTIAEELR